MTSTAAVPSPARQKSFIIENAGILDSSTKRAIIAVVMLEVGETPFVETRDSLDIDLDFVASASEDVLRHVFNIVRARLEALGQPATGARAR
jgi:hypothetical protein